MGDSYRDLIVWQKSRELVKEVYVATRGFPKEELFVLTSQIRRAAISIPSNLAEGRGRFSRADFLHFLMQARGSLFELEPQLLIAHGLGYITSAQHSCLGSRCTEVGKLL